MGNRFEITVIAVNEGNFDKSMTVLPDPAIAKSMIKLIRTPAMVMGVKAGINLINQVYYLVCIIIEDNNKIYSSKNINPQ
jgi:thiamine biosynthesis lipoprotein